MSNLLRQNLDPPFDIQLGPNLALLPSFFLLSPEKFCRFIPINVWWSSGTDLITVARELHARATWIFQYIDCSFVVLPIILFSLLLLQCLNNLLRFIDNCHDKCGSRCTCRPGWRQSTQDRCRLDKRHPGYTFVRQTLPKHCQNHGHLYTRIGDSLTHAYKSLPRRSSRIRFGTPLITHLRPYI